MITPYDEFGKDGRVFTTVFFPSVWEESKKKWFTDCRENYSNTPLIVYQEIGSSNQQGSDEYELFPKNYIRIYLLTLNIDCA